eukprot:gene23787-23293_t
MWVGVAACGACPRCVRPPHAAVTCCWGAEGRRAGIGVTIVESLGTLWLAGLRREFDDSVAYLLSPSHTFDVNATVSVFEFTIRVVGGLLSAYDLSHHRGLLRKAADAGRRVIGAFTGPAGFPLAAVDLASGRGEQPDWGGYSAALAEVGSVQVELARLTQLTGDAEYAAAGDRVVDVLLDHAPGDGLVSGRVTLGARGDSFVEYLLKRWLIGGGTDDRLRGAFVAAAEAVLANLTAPAPLPAPLRGESALDGALEYKMDHLACFFPGTLALGAGAGGGRAAVTGARRERWLDAARRIAAAGAGR